MGLVEFPRLQSGPSCGMFRKADVSIVTEKRKMKNLCMWIILFPGPDIPTTLLRTWYLPTTSATATDPNRPLEDVIITSAAVTLEVPFCEEKLDGDVDGDCDVDTEDILKFATQWLNPKCVGCYSADINGDGEVNFADFAIFITGRNVK